MGYKLSLLEQETIILFNRAEKEAEVYTFEPTLKKQLQEMAKEFSGVYKKADDRGSVTYMLPKSLIGLKRPRKKRNYTEEERKEIGRKLKESRAKENV